MVVDKGAATRLSLALRTTTEKTYEPGDKVKDDMDQVATAGSEIGNCVTNETHGEPSAPTQVQA